LRGLFVSLIVLTFLLIPLMIVGLNPAAAASYRGGGGGTPSHGGSGGDKGKVGVVKVQVIETVEVISQVTNVVPVIHVVNVPNAPNPVNALPPPASGPIVMDTPAEYGLLIVLVLLVSTISIYDVKGESSDKRHESDSGPSITTPANPTTGGLVAALLGLASAIIPSKSGGDHKTAGKLTSEWSRDNGSPPSGGTAAAEVNIKDMPITKTVDSAGHSDGKPAK